MVSADQLIKSLTRCLTQTTVLCRTGGPSGGILPDPIPNSAVKASSAHGTAAQAAGESVAASPTKDSKQVTRQHKFKRKRRDLTIAAFLFLRRKCRKRRS